MSTTTNTAPHLASDKFHFIVQNEVIEASAMHPPPEDELRELALTSINFVLRHYQEEFEEVEFTLRIVDTEEAQELNRQYRNKDYPTNVLTFEYGVDETATLRADIVICVAVVQQEAQEQGKDFVQHFKHLLAHGVLHALGFDHETDDEAESMEALEIEILAQFSIKNPYL